ncbi:hypothetical protein PT277_04740 [Acetobacteraceae bacterium ESL0709]|nr:hypothetical protein [Acetobacteraceae bacterium ESL0697]MDF7678002.1 hypothetical protein [Acetobacteraceae bacterium ESL0709]
MADQVTDPFYQEVKETLDKVRKNNDDKVSRWFHENAASIREKIDAKLYEIILADSLPQKAEAAYKAGKIEKPRKLEELLSPAQRESKDKHPDFKSPDVVFAILGSEAQPALFMAWDTLKHEVAIASKHVKQHD